MRHQLIVRRTERRVTGSGTVLCTVYPYAGMLDPHPDGKGLLLHADPMRI